MTTQSSTLTEEVKFWLLRTAQGLLGHKKGFEQPFSGYYVRSTAISSSLV
jgi:hypothetical protein